MNSLLFIVCFILLLNLPVKGIKLYQNEWLEWKLKYNMTFSNDEQTYKNFELIIVDNYSIDNTLEIVNSFMDDHIKYFQFTNLFIINNT